MNALITEGWSGSALVAVAFLTSIHIVMSSLNVSLIVRVNQTTLQAVSGAVAQPAKS